MGKHTQTKCRHLFSRTLRFGEIQGISSTTTEGLDCIWGDGDHTFSMVKWWFGGSWGNTEYTYGIKSWFKGWQERILKHWGDSSRSSVFGEVGSEAGDWLGREHEEKVWNWEELEAGSKRWRKLFLPPVVTTFGTGTLTHLA